MVNCRGVSRVSSARRDSPLSRLHPPLHAVFPFDAQVLVPELEEYAGPRVAQVATAVCSCTCYRPLHEQHVLYTCLSGVCVASQPRRAPPTALIVARGLVHVSKQVAEHVYNMAWRYANIIEKKHPSGSFMAEPYDLYKNEVAV